MDGHEEQEAEPASSDKPLREQRTILGEVGIIVLGVLIALVIGEIATAIRQRVEAERSMEAIRSDMVDNSAAFEISQHILSCATRRLDAVSQEVDDARRTGRLRDIGEIGRSASSTYRSGSWDSAVANRDTLFLDRDRVATLTDFHEALRVYRSLEEQMALDWARLGILTHAPGRIDDDSLATARQTLAELRHRTRLAAILARLLLEHHQKLGFPVEYRPFNGQPRNREETLRRVNEGSFCQPLQVAPDPV